MPFVHFELRFHRYIVDLWSCSIQEEGATLWNKSMLFVHLKLRSTGMVDFVELYKKKV